MRRRLALAAIAGSALIALALSMFGAQLHRGLALTALPLALAIGLAMALFQPEARREKLAIGAVLGLFAIYAAEIALGRSKPRDATVAARQGRAFDTRTTGEVVRDLHARRVDAFPSVPPRSLVAKDGMMVPIGGLAERTTVFCNEGGAFAIYDSDEHGLRNPRGLWGSGTIDLAITGEAFLQGACVAPGAGAADLIRARYPRTVSLAMADDGPLIALAGIAELLPAVKPKVVLWFHYNRMLGSLEIERTSPILVRYLDGLTQELARQQTVVDWVIHEHLREQPEEPAWSEGLGLIGLSRRSTPVWIQDLVMGEQHSSAAAALRLDWVSAAITARTSRTSRGDAPPDFALYARILERAKATVSSWGGALVFVYLADVHNLRGKEHPMRKPALDMVAAAGLPLIDLQPVFAAAPDPDALRFHEQSHYNEAGYRLVADTVLAGVAKVAENAGIAPSR